MKMYLAALRPVFINSANDEMKSMYAFLLFPGRIEFAEYSPFDDDWIHLMIGLLLTINTCKEPFSRAIYESHLKGCRYKTQCV